MPRPSGTVGSALAGPLKVRLTEISSLSGKLLVLK
jgi:hypothetical protein